MSAARVLLLCCLFASAAVLQSDANGCEESPWAAERVALWQAVETRAISDEALAAWRTALDSDVRCPGAQASAAALMAISGKQKLRGLDGLRAHLLGDGLAEALCSGFPVFGALDWLAEMEGTARNFESCADESTSYRKVLEHHLNVSGGQSPMPPTSLPALEFLQKAAATGSRCGAAQASAILTLALGQAESCPMGQEMLGLVGRAQALLGKDLPGDWPVAKLLHELSRVLQGKPRVEPTESCLIIIYAFPTAEIKSDTAEALRSLEKYYVQELKVRPSLVVFTDQATAATLQDDLGSFTSLPLVPAVIPPEELSRHMLAYSCKDGLDCAAGEGPSSDAHRGVVNATQFWSPSYLRISRYTAGPLFLHSALDSCSHFLKIDTDFFFTAPLTEDPIEGMRRAGARLAYWQLHVQGQRQAGYMDASLAFLREKNLPIRNKAFYARGRFEEKAEKLGISLDSVPEATEAATVIYGCLFGGDVRFFREPLYQSFFAFMDAKKGFETSGWSNQFFLGTAAAALLSPSQVHRLYISGRHQESSISTKDGNVTEFLLGASHAMFR